MKTADLVTNETLTDNYVRKFNAFLEKHSSRLIDILENQINETESNTSRAALISDEDSLISSAEHERQKKRHKSFVSTYALTHNVWDIKTDPIQIIWGPFLETSSYEELICSFPMPSDLNPDVPKVLLVLVSLTSQMKELTKYGWKHFVFQIILYGDGFDSDHGTPLSSSPPQSTSVTEGEGHVAISTFLPVLYHLKEFVADVETLLMHSFQQLEALFKDSRPHVVSISGVNFPTFFHQLGNLLALIIVLDEIISSQSLLTEHWTKYKRMITSVRADSANFDIDSESLAKLEIELEELNRTVLGGRIFRNLLFFVTSKSKLSKRNATLLEKFLRQLSSMEGTLEQNFIDGSDELRPIAFIGLFVLFSSLLTFDARKVFRNRIWPVLKKIPAVPIGGNLLWTPDSFLGSLHVGNQISFLDMKLLEGQAQARHAFLESRISSVQTIIVRLHLDVHSWTIRLQELMYGRDISQLRREDLSKRSSCLLDGVKLAQRLNLNFRLVINLHATLGRSVTVQIVSYLIHHLELLKMIQSSFYRFNVQICHTVLFLVQTVLHIGLTNVKQVKDAILSSLNRSNKDVEVRRDALSIISVLENALKGPPSEQRLLTAKVTFDWSIGRCYPEDEEKKEIIQAALDRIQSMVSLLDQIDELCNGSLIYWHRQLLSSYLTSVYSNEVESLKLPSLSLVLDDCLHLLGKKSPHLKGNVRNGFLKEVESYFKGCIIDKLCTDVEIDLRLQTHLHLQVNQQPMDSSLFRLGVKDFGTLLDLPSLILRDNKISLKFIVEYYLSKNFYNLASVALHDWQSYATMRVLASDKYKLAVIEDHLPGHSLEQGLDILAIVRTLRKFVTEFSYNLNNQVFIQVTSPNKHLDTVSIRHLANSMRTHGLGMSNSAVNCAYQFLRTKIHSFSQFLFDEQIKSKLAKDLRTFKQLRQSQESSGPGITTPFSYPYDKAQKFQKGIRKLGLTSDNLSPLDQFRILITQIGNTLGFVRLVVSGGRHYLALGTRFLTDLDENTKFKDLAESSVINNGKDIHEQDLLFDSAENVDTGIRNLGLQQSPGISYFHMLFSAFHSTCILS